jgi:kynurenine formamidase
MPTATECGKAIIKTYFDKYAPDGRVYNESIIDEDCEKCDNRYNRCDNYIYRELFYSYDNIRIVYISKTYSCDCHSGTHNDVRMFVDGKCVLNKETRETQTTSYNYR